MQILYRQIARMLDYMDECLEKFEWHAMHVHGGCIVQQQCMCVCVHVVLSVPILNYKIWYATTIVTCDSFLLSVFCIVTHKMFMMTRILGDDDRWRTVVVVMLLMVLLVLLPASTRY